MSDKAPQAKAAPAQPVPAPSAPPSDKVTLTIDDHTVTVPKGTLIVDAAETLGIEIPIFCSHPKLDPVACCRMCLVEVVGPRGPMLQTACSVPVTEGMVVRTDTEQVKATQEANLAFLLLNHPLDCPICDKGGECPLQDQTMRYGPGISQLVEPKRLKAKHYLISDTIVLDQERCVLCWRCIRYLDEWEDKPQLALFERGGATIIDIQDGKPVDAVTSGNIIDICPVGALTNRVARFAYRPWEIERTPSVCVHCSVGCNLRIDSRTHKVRRLVGRENMAVNDQWLCDKGRFSHAWVNVDNRLKMPLVRKDGELLPATWSEALQVVATRLQEIKRVGGADAVGFIGSPKVSNEGNYLLQRFARQVIGTNNVDHRDGGDVAGLPTGLPALAELMKPQYGPDPKVDVVVLVGVDPEEELPILGLHIKRAVRRANMQVIAVHPRKIELTRYGGPHLAARPGTEVTLINGLTRAALGMVQNKLPEAAQLVADATDARLRDVVGVDPAEVRRAAELLAKAKRAVIIYGPDAGRGPAGDQLLAALGNLAMVTGHADRLAYVGLDANSQGCRDMGVLPHRLPGHVPVDDEAARKRLDKLWGSAPTSRKAGLSYRQMMDNAGGAIKALYVMGADPAGERPSWAANLDNLDFLVVQELFLTETAKRADVVLPALGWGETDGTFTNLERRVQRAPAAVKDPESKAAPDWMILDHLATRLGFNWPYGDARAILNEIGKATGIYRDTTWEAIGDQGLQWDAAAVRKRPALRRAEQGEVAPTGAWFDLVAGRALYDHGTLFGLTTQMQNMQRGATVAMHPDDAAKLGIVDGTPLAVRNGNGTLVLAAKLDATVRPGSVWIPESLPGAPVGALLDGRAAESVEVKPAAQ